MPCHRHRSVTATERLKFKTKYLEEYLGNWSAVLDNRRLDHVDRCLRRRKSGHNVEGRHLAQGVGVLLGTPLERIVGVYVSFNIGGMFDTNFTVLRLQWSRHLTTLYISNFGSNRIM